MKTSQDNAAPFTDEMTQNCMVSFLNQLPITIKSSEIVVIVEL